MTRRALDHGDGGRRRVDGMVAGAAEPTAKRAKKDKEDPLVRRRNELILGVAHARVAMKAKGNKAVREATEPLMQDLRAVCAELEAKNWDELLKKLPSEVWSKIVDEYLQQNDLLALAMTCRFFGDTAKDLGKKLETNLERGYLLNLQEGGKVASHSLGWFRWVMLGFEDYWSMKRMVGQWLVKGVVDEDYLMNYAAFQGSVEILRWLVEEKGFELNLETTSVECIGLWAGFSGSVEVLKYLSDRGNGFNTRACAGAAEGGHLGALQYLRGLDPPCPWDIDTCKWAAWGGHLDILKWARSEDPPCPWDVWTCAAAAEGGHLEVLHWLREQDPPCPWGLSTCSFSARGGHLEVLKFARGQDPPCRWGRDMCRELASQNGHEHVIEWIDQQPLIDPRERHWAAIDLMLGVRDDRARRDVDMMLGDIGRQR